MCEGLSRDALVIDMSTIHPLQTDALIRDMAEQGFSLMDVPVGRTSDHAIAGTLLLLAGWKEGQQLADGVEQVSVGLPALFTAQQALIIDRLAQLGSEVNLYKALGGGWGRAAG